MAETTLGDSFTSLFTAQLYHFLYVNGQFEDAVATAEKALMMSGRHSWVMFMLALIFADWGKATDADALYAEMLARARREYVPPAAHRASL